MASSFPPRPRNTLGFSLGAVGGPRGTGAGITRVLLQYVTQYDKGQLEQLTKDLQALQQQQTQANQQLQAAGTRQKAIEDEITRAKQARANLDQTGLKALKAVADTQARARAEEEKLGRVSQATTQTLLQRERTFRALSGLTAQQSAALLNQFNNQKQLSTAIAQTNAAREQAVALDQRINAVEEQGIAIATARAQLFSQVKNLIMGAVGGVIGGAIIGAVLYEPLQKTLEAVANFSRDILDPAHKARDAVGELGDEINQLVTDEELTRLGAAVELINRLPSQFGQRVDPSGLAEAGLTEILKKNNAEFAKYIDQQQHSEQLTQEQINAATKLLILADRQAGTLHTISGAELQRITISGEGLEILDRTNRLLGDQKQRSSELGLGIIDLNYYYEQVAAAIGEINAEQAAGVDHTQEWVAAAAALRDELAGAAVEAASSAVISGIEGQLDATLGRIRTEAEGSIDYIRRRADNAADAARAAGDKRIDAIQDRMRALEVVESRRTKNLEAALDALKDAGPSRRTKELADQIERLNNAQEKAEFRSRLAAIAEEKSQILLRERLRMSKGEIDLDRYKGKDRLIAIDALLDRMRKQNEAQQRFNQLLDIQYQIQQGVRRAQGETINEFIQRRAQYYRGLLQQAGDLQREGPEAELEAEKHRVEVSIELRELERQRRELIDDRARKHYMDSLQEQLRASQDRDQKELENRREMLQKQLAASRKADQDALEARRQALQNQIEAVRKATQNEIESINKRRDAEIHAREAARDRAIDTAQKAAEFAIEAERRRAEQVQKWSSFSETERLIEAIKGSKDVAEAYRFAGALAGANFSEAALTTQMQLMGVDPWVIQQTLANVRAIRDALSNRVNQLAPRAPTPPAYGPPGSNSPGGGGYQEGGAFLLRNSRQNPFSSDIRYGEDGRDEIGVILSNKVVQALQGREGGGQGLIGGDMIIQTQEDPHRARAAWRREMKSLIREELSH